MTVRARRRCVVGWAVLFLLCRLFDEPDEPEQAIQNK
jgi:hypothetical protein